MQIADNTSSYNLIKYIPVKQPQTQLMPGYFEARF